MLPARHQLSNITPRKQSPLHGVSGGDQKPAFWASQLETSVAKTVLCSIELEPCNPALLPEGNYRQIKPYCQGRNIL